MQTHELGSSGVFVSAIGLGCMGMSGMYGPADESESIATIHAALDLHLNADGLAQIEQAVPVGSVSGKRYNIHGMATLDSEKRSRE